MNPSEPAKPELTTLNVSISSDYTSDPREDVWLTDDSFKVAPYFSDPISENLVEEYQTKEVHRRLQLLRNRPMRQRANLIPRNDCRNYPVT